MDNLIADQIEWLLANNSNTNRLGRQLLLLVGFLADGNLPDDIARQTDSLSRLVVLQDLFDALISALNAASRKAPFGRPDQQLIEGFYSPEAARLIDQIESAQKNISESEPVNYSGLIAWTVTQAKAHKIFRVHGRK